MYTRVLLLPSLSLRSWFLICSLLIHIFQGGLVFVCGSKEGLMLVSGRRHNTDDIIATVLAVEPNRFIYRGRYVLHPTPSSGKFCYMFSSYLPLCFWCFRIAVFSIPVLKDERICIVAEQRPDCSEEEVCQSVHPSVCLCGHMSECVDVDCGLILTFTLLLLEFPVDE